MNTLKMSVAEALTWLRDPPAEHARFAKLVCLLASFFVDDSFLRCEIAHAECYASKMSVT